MNKPNQTQDSQQIIAQLQATIAQQQQQIAQLKQNNDSHYLNGLLQYLPIGAAIVHGPELKYYRINNYLAQLHGKSIEQHLTQPMRQVMPELAKQVIPIIQQVIETQQPSKQREFTLEKNGEVKQLIDFHYPLDKQSALSLVLDITERKTMVEAVHHSKEELEANLETLKATQHQLVQTAKLATIGQLTAGLAHELNQPLGRIFLTAELVQSLLKKSQIDVKRADELLSRIIRDVKGATNLMNHLRMYSRQDVTSRVEPINLRQLIDDLLILFTHQMKIADIQFELKLEHTEQQLLADAGQIEQVINNLMNNAIHAVKKQPTRKITLASYTRDNKVNIQVKDSGYGMSEHVLNNMFDPFFTTKESGEGTGLGLSICRGIIENHHGELTVESELNQGTCITVSLPINH